MPYQIGKCFGHQCGYYQQKSHLMGPAGPEVMYIRNKVRQDQDLKQKKNKKLK